MYGLDNSAFIDTWFMNQNMVYLITVISAFEKKASRGKLVNWWCSNFLSTDFCLLVLSVTERGVQK